MPEYQVLARKYRPQRFSEVLDQEPVITTLKNAIQSKRLAHAYLFCGPRGTGKTTTARLFAKALNCSSPVDGIEPCNECSSCKEITSGSSLDVLEIDGASNRGIDEIRRLNDSVGYATASGNYKIIIIDEVHMLTKEAFNALLKTLEEPPPHVKFFFATTEPHKVLPTILSRCQRFNLNRISPQFIEEKLRNIAKDQDLSIAEDAFRLISHAADGGLRDAETIFDQIISFTDGKVTLEAVADILGVMSRELLFSLDDIEKNQTIALAFEIAGKVFSSGKDIPHFIDTLIDHFRILLLTKFEKSSDTHQALSGREREHYIEASKRYRQEQLLYILDLLTDLQSQIKFSPSQRTCLEVALIKILRSHQRVPVDMLMKRLIEMEKKLSNQPAEKISENRQAATVKPLPPPPPKPTVKRTPPPPKRPTPPSSKPPPPSKPKEPPKPLATLSKEESHYDTLLQFATVELEGTLKKHKTKR